MLTSTDTMTINSMALTTGVTLQYTERGDPDAVPVLFLHGTSDSLHSFAPILPYLPSSIRAIAVSQRGHGDSSRPESGYWMADFAADAVALLDALEIDSAIVAGHSMGTLIAMRAALDYPERIRGLVLLAAFHPPLGDSADLQELAGIVQAFDDPVDPEFVREFQLSTIQQAVDEDFIDLVVGESLKLPAFVWQDAIAGMLSEDPGGRLGTISVPTLLVWGDRDEYTRLGDQEALVSTIPGARLVTFRGSGHALHWEQPERVTSDIAGFVLEVAS